MICGDYMPRNIAALAPKGRLVFIAVQGGSKAEVDFLPVMLKRLTISGSTLRARPVAEKAQITYALKRNVWPLFDKGLLTPVIDRVYPLSEVAEAHKRMESSQHIGKLILVP
jgi:NADPH:quinone reductase-like Zn-dependent oxidoreductase